MKGASAVPGERLGSSLEIDCGREGRPFPAAAAAAIKSALPLSLPIHLQTSRVTPPSPKGVGPLPADAIFMEAEAQ